MRLNNISIKILTSALFFAIVFVIGCNQGAQEAFEYKVNLAYAEDLPSDDSIWPDKDLMSRFKAYWHMHFSGDIEGMWELEAPYFQFMADKSAYSNYHAMAIARLPVDIKINSIKNVSEYLYSINMTINFTRGERTNTATLTEHWVSVQGKWFHVLRDPIIFPF